jgi:hypothetical protein
MATTYEKIATTTLGSASATITFSSISSAYTDLRLVITALQGSGNNIALRFNSDSGTNYSRTRLIGNGTSATSTRATDDTEIDLNREALSSTNPSLYEVDIFSYAGSTYKTLLATSNEDRNGSGSVVRAVGLWRDTTAINSITITSLSADTMGAGTSATLYGILKA